MEGLSIQEVRDYLSIDFEDETTDRILARLINTADAYLRGAVGENYPRDSERAKQIALMLISDLYDNRGMNTTASINSRKIIDDFALQLRIELRRRMHEKTNTDTTA